MPANRNIHICDNRRQVRLNLIEWYTRLKRDAGAQDVECASIQGRRQTTYERAHAGDCRSCRLMIIPHERERTAQAGVPERGIAVVPEPSRRRCLAEKVICGQWLVEEDVDQRATEVCPGSCRRVVGRGRRVASMEAGQCNSRTKVLGERPGAEPSFPQITNGGCRRGRIGGVREL